MKITPSLLRKHSGEQLLWLAVKDVKFLDLIDLELDRRARQFASRGAKGQPSLAA